MEQCYASLMDVKRFAVHDGPGIRTTFFLKGCPLACLWCHNPEGISGKPQMAYYPHKCLDCGECAVICPVQAQTVEEGRHVYHREKCRSCGACEEVCLGEAMHLFGARVSPEEVLAVAREDRIFYEQSGGGVTFSGGEPLLQADFCKAAAQSLQAEGIPTAIDTCGFVPFEAFEKVLPYTDIFLFDIKHIDATEHRRLTGQSNELILQNIQRLSEQKARIEVRTPLVPGCNDGEDVLDRMGEFLGQLRIEKMRILPYHAMARSKYAALGLRDTMPEVPSPTEETVQRAVDILKKHGVNAVSGRE